MKKKSCVFTLAILYLFLNEINAQNLDRGPYLQTTTISSIYIHWRTDSATDSKVWYGNDHNNLDQTLTSPTDVTDHEMLIPGLSPNTVYYYAVGNSSGEMAGGDVNHYFKTAPLSTEPIRIWVLGDAGKKSDDQIAVRDAYYGFVGNAPIDIMLLLGDNAYSDGTQQDYQDAWFESTYGYPDRLINSVMWPTFGNHDGNSANSNTQTGPYYEIYNLPTNGQAGGVGSGTEAYYSFDYGNMHIICLNSHDIDDSQNSPMMQWLANDVAANTKDWLIAMFHHPAYTGGTSSMQTNALPILEDGGCDLVLVGHHHWYERSFMINGHYGPPNSFDPETMALDEGDGRVDGDGAYTKPVGGPGTIYMTSGSAGSGGSGSSEHPIMYYNGGMGSVDIQVNGLQMDLQFVKHDGNVTDYFTIFKVDGPPTVDITYPPNNTFYPNPETIDITADANDNGSISTVEFFINNTSIGFDNTYPYKKTWTMPGTGTFDVKVVATDNDNFSSSETVVVQVGDGTVCVEVSTSNDDAEEDSAGGMSITSSDLELVLENSEQIIGMRFTSLNIPNEAVINSSSIQFTCDKVVNVNPCNLAIYAELSDNASTFSNSNYNVTSRTKTDAFVIWNPPDWLNEGDAGPSQKTIDISPVIQEVVNLPGFDINSPIAIIIEGTGKREAESYNGTAAPELCIEFSIDAPLPVELISFDAKPIDDEIQLNWITASEENNDYFTLERSTDGRSFEELKMIIGNGTTSAINNYSYLDQNPEIGLNYYRLKQVDYGGDFTFSDIVNAEISDINHILVYPSKVKDFVTIEKSRTIKNQLNILIQDMAGNTYQKLIMQDTEFKKEISVAELVPGIYIISIYYNDSVENFKIVKM